uniref:Uncharacterized protein n=1 Tax=Anopheles maculatus TaxID=74869 RepID=A0A182SF47_9DIPT
MFDFANCTTTTPDLMRSSFYPAQPPSVLNSNYHNIAPTSKLLEVRSGRLPARRYSISGSVPLSSMVDYCNLSENAANLYTQSANLTNLLNETTKSLSRSSNILNMRSLGTTASGDSGINLPMSHATTLFAQPSHTSASTASSTNICGVLDPSPSISLERMATSAAASAAAASGFLCSYPNTSSISHLPNAHSNNSNLSYYHHHLQHHMPQLNQQIMSLPQQLQQSQPNSFSSTAYRPTTDYLLSKPIYSNNTLNAATNSASLLSQPHTSTSRYPSSIEHSHFLHTLHNNIDSSGFFKYPTTYHTPYSKLDLDYNRANDMKRQICCKRFR